jgi:16S rRNA (uracil1498-N3)-methyltransferase
VNELLRRAAAHVLVHDVEFPLLDEATSHHVFRVLRVGDGQTVTVTDGAGRWRSCRAVAGALQVDGAVTEEPGSHGLELFVAIPKQDRPEWLVQKATELGVRRLVFVHSERSVVRWSADRAERHLVKLRRIAAEAALQSRRVWLPLIEGPVDARRILPDVVVAEPGGRALEAGDRAVAIGPEGGWSREELDLAQGSVGLAAHVLRVETAAVTACAIAGQLVR